MAVVLVLRESSPSWVGVEFVKTKRTEVMLGKSSQGCPKIKLCPTSFTTYEPSQLQAINILTILETTIHNFKVTSPSTLER